jgi:hypothetical protein
MLAPIVPLVLQLTARAAAAPPAPLPPTELVHLQAVAQPLQQVRACLRASLAAAGPVAGVLPSTSTVDWPGGARIEQWFIAPITHQRTAFELGALSGTATEVRIYLLQRHGQYVVGGYQPAALRALDRCARPVDGV